MEDALSSIEAGADALGFIFSLSKRWVSPERAQEIIRELPSEVEKIGVFMDAGPMEISRIVNAVSLTGIQMHGEGDLPPEVYSCLPKDRRDRLRKIKAIMVREGFDGLFDSYDNVPEVVNTWLFDSGAGSGKSFEWHTARTKLAQRKGQFVIAGGLKPENVGDAMQAFKPWGVDVVTGVEREPGRKDREKLKAFVAAVRRAEES